MVERSFAFKSPRYKLVVFDFFINFFFFGIEMKEIRECRAEDLGA